MSLGRRPGPRAMSNSTHSPTTVRNIGVMMFSVADQDAALAFYTQKLGFEVRGDDRFGPNGEYRWLEVAPPGSTARLALNPPMDGTPGGSAIGVETADVRAEHERLRALEPAPDRRRDLRGAERPLERVRGHEHRPPLSALHAGMLASAAPAGQCARTRAPPRRPRCGCRRGPAG